MKITIDFDTNIVKVDDTELYIDNLEQKKNDIYAAIGLQELPMADLRADINNLFDELGLNVKCAEEGE